MQCAVRSLPPSVARLPRGGGVNSGSDFSSFEFTFEQWASSKKTPPSSPEHTRLKKSLTPKFRHFRAWLRHVPSDSRRVRKWNSTRNLTLDFYFMQFKLFQLHLFITKSRFIMAHNIWDIIYGPLIIPGLEFDLD